MDYQIVTGDDGLVVKVDTTQGAAVITLPAPVATFKVTIKDIGGYAGTNRINIIRNASEKIDGIAADSSIEENWAAVTYVSDGTDWYRMDSFHRNLANTGRAVFTGGDSSIVMDYFTIATLGTATTFGNSSLSRQSSVGTSSTTRGLFSGGSAGGSDSAVIDYITIATTGNAVSFGNLTTSRLYAGAGSSQTRSIVAGSYKASAANNVIDYTTIQTLGNAVSFGTLATSKQLAGQGSMCSPTRAVCSAGGFTGSNSAVIEYVTIATLGNSVSFGNLTTARFNPGILSNSTRGVIGGGHTGSQSTVMDYITIATTGNAVSFGNLVGLARYVAGTASQIRGLWATGSNLSGVNSLAAEYITMSTTSNSATFGSASFTRAGSGALSSCHGGLNG